MICLVLVDSGATSSFINREFLLTNQLESRQLEVQICCRAFNGSSSAANTVTEVFDGIMQVPLRKEGCVVTQVSLNVITISSAGIILGSDWLRRYNSFVGGTENNVVMHVVDDISDVINHKDTEQLLKNYSDVFVTDSLA